MVYRYTASGRVRTLEYATRDIAVLARELERRGNRVLYLNIGDSLRYDFSPPSFLRRALATTLLLR